MFGILNIARSKENPLVLLTCDVGKADMAEMEDSGMGGGGFMVAVRRCWWDS